MADKRTTEEQGAHHIHTPGGMYRPPDEGDAADGADIASTDMAIDTGGSRAEPEPATAGRPVGRLLDALDRLAASDAPAEALRAELAVTVRRLREELGSGQ